jgi:hypothetical protein
MEGWTHPANGGVMHEASADRGTPIGSVVTIVGGGLLAVGSFLEWVSLSGSGFSESTTGVDGSDGWITFAAGLLAILAGVLALRSRRRRLGVLAILAGLAGGGVGLYDALTVRDSIAEELASQLGTTVAEARAGVDLLVDSGQLDIQMGIGLYLVLAGGVLALTGGVLLLLRRRDEARPEPSTVDQATPAAAATAAPEAGLPPVPPSAP